VPQATEFYPAKLEAEQDACIESLEKENYNKGQPTVRLQQVTQTLYRIIHM